MWRRRAIRNFGSAATPQMIRGSDVERIFVMVIPLHGYDEFLARLFEIPSFLTATVAPFHSHKRSSLSLFCFGHFFIISLHEKARLAFQLFFEARFHPLAARFR